MAVITRDDDPNQIFSPATDDEIFALGGDDIIFVGDDTGFDKIDGGTGTDTLATGGSDSSALVALGDRGIETGFGQLKNGFIIVGGGDFGTLVSVEDAAGGSGSDVLFGNDGDNVLHGGPEGDDYLEGALGADQLQGFAGNDTAGYEGAAAPVFVFLAAPNLNGGEAAGDTFISIENISGSAFGDLLSGDTNNNRLTGHLGNDFLAGAGGDDVLDGRSGDDFLASGAGKDAMNGGADTDTASYELATAGVLVNLVTPGNNTGEAIGDTYVLVENIRGSSFNDELLADNLVNFIDGSSGDDQLFGRGGDDSLRGGLGADVLSGGSGTDAADYSESSAAIRVSLLDPTINTRNATGDTYVSIETLIGSAFADRLDGNNALNRLEGRDGNDRLFGNNGSDILVGGLGADAHDGGAGIDTADYSSAAAGLRADLTVPGANTGEAAGDTYVSIEWLTGSNFADFLGGNAGNNLLRGGGGADRLAGRAGGDMLIGGDGDDILDGGVGGDSLNGGTGIDTAKYTSSAEGVVVDFLDPRSANAGGASGDRYTSVENVLGSGHGDNLSGDDNANTIDGDAGNDVLNGRGGNDLVIGGTGSDVLEGGEGEDTLQGGAGSDTASYAGATEKVGASLSVADFIGGEAFGDVYDSIENIVGSLFGDNIIGNDFANRLDGGGGGDFLLGLGGSDTLIGGAGNDSVSGNDGSDTLDGGGGHDTLEGGVGNDNLVGGNGSDRLAGGSGNDTLTGGVGADDLFAFSFADLNTDGARDIFRYLSLSDSGTTETTRDEIFGFIHGPGGASDRIDLSAIDANLSLAGDQKFTLVSTFTAAKGEVRLLAVGADTLVQVDGDNDSAVNMTILVHNVVGMSAADLIL